MLHMWDRVVAATAPRPAGTRTGSSPRRRRTLGRESSSFSVGLESLESRDVPTVMYYGGPLLQRVQVQALYYGSEWTTNATLRAQAGRFEGFLGNVVNSSYMDMMTSAGYSVGRGSSSAGRIDPAVIDKRYYLTDGRIQSVIQQDISRGLEQPGANRLYVMFVEPNVAVKLGSDDSITGFYGYHNSFVGYDARGMRTNIYYAVIPYHGGINGQINQFNTFDSMTDTTSHELAEAVTDPVVGRGWYDYRLNGEIGDLTRGAVRLNGYVVQNVVDKYDRPISPAGSTPVAGGRSGGFGAVGGHFAAAPRPLTVSHGYHGAAPGASEIHCSAASGLEIAAMGGLQRAGAEAPKFRPGIRAAAFASVTP